MPGVGSLLLDPVHPVIFLSCYVSSYYDSIELLVNNNIQRPRLHEVVFLELIFIWQVSDLPRNIS